MLQFNLGLTPFTAFKCTPILKNRPQRRFSSFAYPLAMAAILGTSATCFYILFACSLNKQLDERLLSLGQGAIPGLDTVKTEGKRSLERNFPWSYLLSTHQQSIEWFDANSQLLAREGGSVYQFLPIDNPSIKHLREGVPLFQTQGQIRSVTITVYAKNIAQANLDKTTPLLDGYIRVNQSTQDLENILYLLRLGLAGLTILIVISISGFYFAQKPLEPIQETNQALEQSFQAKDLFAINLSHHLRNLLTRINLSVELMLSHAERFQPSDSRKLETINVAAQQMQRLIEDLLFLSRNNTDAISSEMERLVIPLDEMIFAVVQKFEAIATAKKITLEVYLSPGISIKGDAAQLNRLFSILLDNALKYTDAGGKVTLSLTKARGVTVFKLEDTGIGIAPESLPFIFRWFWHSEPKRERQHEGMGLGLAIAQSIVERHGGKISATSREGIGSSFQISLPITSEMETVLY
jgi:signal transduction histidine kinase